MSRGASILIGFGVALLFLVSLALPLAPITTLAEHDPSLAGAIIAELRMPRTLLAIAYGAMLGASGAAVQALFANPLASPDLTGTTSGAALGAVVTAYLFALASPLALAVGAITGASAALGLLLLLAGPRAETATLLLAGLAISALAGALATLALALAPSPFAFYDAYAWLMGSLVDRSLQQAAFAALPALIAILALLRFAGPLDVMALGEEVAASFGHDVARIRLAIIALTAFGVGACVAVCGAVGFIGLVAPVFARRLTGGHPGRAILPAALIGAALLAAADCLVRLAPFGRTLPLGVLTALIGAPFFLWLVAHMRWRLTQ
jgi:iron complex transport system permease protein